jgi:predicted CoA-substrate-specific enzyme activase
MNLGIDIGSTTVKLVIVRSEDGSVAASMYRRHNAAQVETLREMLLELLPYFPLDDMYAAVCGSGAKPVAKALGIPYIQEVIANATAVGRLYPQVRTAIELGGQDAKVVFFSTNPQTGACEPNDMRMNGSCAGGTGAFIDEIASLLKVPPEGFETLAAAGERVHSISGRCGVFAKTDIQPLLLQGARREDIALSSFHAIAKQTIGGLSQGLELKAPVIFEGGPLTFNPTLRRVFEERLHLREGEAIVPDHPETIVAYGAAIAADRLPGSTSITLNDLLLRLSRHAGAQSDEADDAAAPFFPDEVSLDAFRERHLAELGTPVIPRKGEGYLPVWIGIDSGSTTSKFVLVDGQERVIDSFYAGNYGEPLKVLQEGLLQMRDKYRQQGIELSVKGLCTTGYGERMVASAFGADIHTVETMAHSTGALKTTPDVSFILDIGGQDMKAIWIKDDVITQMMLNEACSSGCGSFLENFAATLNIPVTEIAEAAFRSKSPARLGSRCTVFMNSTIIHEQRSGKDPQDLMAGLCRSIIENVFTKVVRISSPRELGDKIVVQGGTFRNFAVLRAMEEYVGRDVTLAPFPGEMGALGAALIARRSVKGGSQFIGFDALESFTWETRSGIRCGRCENNCALTTMRFPSGKRFVSGNRCEKGAGKSQVESLVKKAENLFDWRNEHLFADVPVNSLAPYKGVTIGIPRVLEFWDSYPFWSVFLRSLGYNVVLSDYSSRKDFERGLQFVASDTICFPAKLAHGHILNLVSKGVDRIFFPYVMHMPPEGVDKQSPYVCTIVQGYPMVVRNSQNPGALYGIPLDSPVFHFFTPKDWPVQIQAYAVKQLGVCEKEAKAAFAEAEKALLDFRGALREQGAQLLGKVRAEGRFAAVVAGRPYQCDPLVSHDIPAMLAREGFAVLPVDALPGLSEQDISNTRVEVTNNYHTRLLEAALIASENPSLEFVQMVSFGCGHDAILSDELIRIMGSCGHKPPLILKIDESDAAGSIGIRIRSFVESVRVRRATPAIQQPFSPLQSAFPVKYYKKDKQLRTILIPNINAEVSRILNAVFEKEGFRCQTIPVGGREQIRLGKRYSHNDICFPCQMVIGELLSALEKGGWKDRQGEVAVGMVKFQCDCRMSHYSALLRKALDDAGYGAVPVVSTDPTDSKHSQPGVHLLGISSVIEAANGAMMMDILLELSRKIRPYELEKGITDKALHDAIEDIAQGLAHSVRAAEKAFERSIEAFRRIPYDRTHSKPRVFVTGELLVTYHPGSNFSLEEYLERNGMETIFPKVSDQLRKDFLASMEEISKYKANIPKYPFAVTWLFGRIQKKLEKVAARHPLFEAGITPDLVYQGVKDIIPKTLSCGEGWLMAAEIAHFARQGVKSHIILQPFGCIPNHVCGRGTIKRLKEDFPHIQILPLDFDPDTGFANVENRLQMLIMNNTSTK